MQKRREVWGSKGKAVKNVAYESLKSLKEFTRFLLLVDATLLTRKRRSAPPLFSNPGDATDISCQYDGRITRVILMGKFCRRVVSHADNVHVDLQ